MENYKELSTNLNDDETVDFIVNKTKLQYVNLKGVNDDTTIKSFYYFLCKYEIWSESDKVIKTFKKINYVAPSKYNNISFVIKFYNMAYHSFQHHIQNKNKKIPLYNDDIEVECVKNESVCKKVNKEVLDKIDIENKEILNKIDVANKETIKEEILNVNQEVELIKDENIKNKIRKNENKEKEKTIEKILASEKYQSDLDSGSENENKENSDKSISKSESEESESESEESESGSEESESESEESSPELKKKGKNLKTKKQTPAPNPPKKPIINKAKPIVKNKKSKKSESIDDDVIVTDNSPIEIPSKTKKNPISRKKK